MSGPTNITGLTGSVTLPGNLVQDVASITISTGFELLDVSHYGGNGWRTRVAGLKDLAGSAVAFMTQGVAGSNPFSFDSTPTPMTITFNTGCSITFDAIIGGTSIAGEYQGNNIVTFNWSKADDTEPTIAWVNS